LCEDQHVTQMNIVGGDIERTATRRETIRFPAQPVFPRSDIAESEAPAQVRELRGSCAAARGILGEDLNSRHINGSELGPFPLLADCSRDITADGKTRLLRPYDTPASEKRFELSEGLVCLPQKPFPLSLCKGSSARKYGEQPKCRYCDP